MSTIGGAIDGLEREYGVDANPWAVTPRSITSMDFLRQPDVLAAFLAAAQRLERGHALAWDLLVVDEAHNLAPEGFSERSDRAKMLAEVAQNAEHRLLLTAAPHNGFTASFSGLLDAVRFRQTSELNDAEHKQVDERHADPAATTFRYPGVPRACSGATTCESSRCVARAVSNTRICAGTKLPAAVHRSRPR
jgi:hypothetical protein